MRSNILTFLKEKIEYLNVFVYFVSGIHEELAIYTMYSDIYKKIPVTLKSCRNFVFTDHFDGQPKIV